MSSSTTRVVCLRAAGASLIVELTEPLPRILHWGRDLGELTGADRAALSLTAEPARLNNAIDIPRRLTVWPTQADGWSGTPAHQGHLDGAATTPRPRLVRADHHDLPGGGAELVLRLADDTSDLDITLTYRLETAGILGVATTMTRRPGRPSAGPPYDLTGVTTLLPLPHRATEILDFTGKWCRERHPQRRPLAHGTYAREVRRGKPGLDSPYLVNVGVPGFGFRDGEVWGLHVGWSGDQRYLVERLPEGAGTHAAVLGGGELLTPGEIRLAPGESYETPVCWYAWSGEGLDGLADRFHTLLRDRPGHPGTPRPLLLNTWEAAYFDHDPDRLRELADRAARVGVERLVLDDGWFTGRRDDTAGLGDWTVDASVWPEGLGPLADHVHALGMQFGLWVEPEMVNLDSAMARDHPEWVLGPSAGLGPSARHQYLVDLTNTDAWTYLFTSLDTLVGRVRRRLPQVGPQPGGPRGGAPTAGRHRPAGRTRPGRRPLPAAGRADGCAPRPGDRKLRQRRRTRRPGHPRPHRPGLGVRLQRPAGTPVDPALDRAAAARPNSSAPTSAPPPATPPAGRTATTFRLVTALFGHPGIERDITRCTPEELDRLAAWTALYRRVPPAAAHRTRGPRRSRPTRATVLHGVVARDGGSALLCWVRLATSADGQSGRVPLPGLRSDVRYRLRVRGDVGPPSLHQIAGPAWITEALSGWVTLPGAILTGAGVPMPTLDPEQAMLIEVRRVPDPG